MPLQTRLCSPSSPTGGGRGSVPLRRLTTRFKPTKRRFSNLVSRGLANASVFFPDFCTTDKKQMAAYQTIFQQTTSRTESPAKVFAKLKSKVDRESSGGVYTRRDLLGKVKEKHGGEFMSSRKRANHWTLDEPDENCGLGFVCKAVTISPMSSPQKTFGFSHEDWSSKPAEDVLSVGERICTPRKGSFLESSARSASKTQNLTEAPRVRDGFGVMIRTPQQKIQAADKETRSVFSPMRSKLRKRMMQTSLLHDESCPLGELPNFKGSPTRRLDKNQTTILAQTRKIFLFF